MSFIETPRYRLAFRICFGSYTLEELTFIDMNNQNIIVYNLFSTKAIYRVSLEYSSERRAFFSSLEGTSIVHGHTLDECFEEALKAFPEFAKSITTMLNEVL